MDWEQFKPIATSIAVPVLYSSWLVVRPWSARASRILLLITNLATALSVVAYDVTPVRRVLEDWLFDEAKMQAIAMSRETGVAKRRCAVEKVDAKAQLVAEVCALADTSCTNNIGMMDFSAILPIAVPRCAPMDILKSGSGSVSAAFHSR